MGREVDRRGESDILSHILGPPVLPAMHTSFTRKFFIKYCTATLYGTEVYFVQKKHKHP